jgi:hypothetical protein
LPADVPIEDDPAGNPRVATALATLWGMAPRLSLAQTEDIAVAAATSPENTVGIAVRDVRRTAADTLQTVLTAAERQRPEPIPTATGVEITARLGCAREAAARWAGASLDDHPHDFAVSYISPAGEKVLIDHNGLSIPVTVHLQDHQLIALAVG